MKAHFRFPFLRVAALLCVLYPLSGFAADGPYLIANDDAPFPTNGVTFYAIGTGGTLTLQKHLATGQPGIAGGYFGLNRIIAFNSVDSQCIYMSEAFSGDVVGISVSTEQSAGKAAGSSTDTGISNGVGLAMNSQYLYASFSDSGNIGTFAVTASCTLSFVSDVAVSGLQGGVVSGMAVHGNTLIATFNDGSIESFDISSGPPVANGDEQNSTGSKGGESYPNGVDITQDGHFAIFGDTATSMLIEVSDISSGKLAPTVVYRFKGGINSSTVMLSPDETVLYVGNTQGDSISALNFNSTTGVLSSGCTSGKLKHYVSGWSYLGGLALQQTTGNGGGVYVAEFGLNSAIGIVNLSTSGGSCTLTEATGSPAPEPNTPGLLSIGIFPPRTF